MMQVTHHLMTCAWGFASRYEKMQSAAGPQLNFGKPQGGGSRPQLLEVHEGGRPANTFPRLAGRSRAI